MSSDNVTSDLGQLLTGERVLTLGLVIDGEPHVSLLPYALLPDHTSAIVQASGLARHTRGLVEGARFSAVIHASSADDPLQIPRITLDGTVHPLERDSSAWTEAAQVFAARVPGAAMTLSLGDFGLYRLDVERGRYVAGFARAMNVTREMLGRTA